MRRGAYLMTEDERRILYIYEYLFNRDVKLEEEYKESKQKMQPLNSLKFRGFLFASTVQNMQIRILPDFD